MRVPLHLAHQPRHLRHLRSLPAARRRRRQRRRQHADEGLRHLPQLGLGLRAGWYLNNCICLERDFSGPFVDTVVRRSVEVLVAYGFDGLKRACRHVSTLVMSASL